MKLVSAAVQGPRSLPTQNDNEKSNKKPPSPTYMAHYAFKALSHFLFHFIRTTSYIAYILTDAKLREVR